MNSRIDQRLTPQTDARLLGLEHYARTEAPALMQDAGSTFEQRFGIQFWTYTYFPAGALAHLHAQDPQGKVIPPGVVEAAQSDRSIRADIDVLTEVANASSLTESDRQEYRAALERVYRKLPDPPTQLTELPDTLCIAPQREGRLLAESMGWLPSRRSLHPDAKRIWYEGGLVVGLSALPPVRPYARAVIIDGAIASGATIIALMEQVRHSVSTFHVFSVHAAREGLWALHRYAQLTNVEVHLTVGFTTPGLNKKYYAIDERAPARAVVGDLGDTICGPGDPSSHP